MADREVVGIELVAKLDQLRSEFKSLPKTTDDETKRAVSLALKNLSKLEKGAAKSASATAGAVAPGAAKAADALKGLDESAKHLGETAGDTDSSLKAVAGAIGLISPEAETALSSIGDLAGGLEGVVKGAGLAGVSLGGIALAAAGIAAVATAVYLVWDATEDARAKTREWEEALADVTLATRTLASAKDAVAKGADDIAGFVGDLQIQTALLRGEIDETDVKLGELGSRLADDLAGDLAEANKALGEQSKQLQTLYSAQADASLSASELAANEIALQKAQANYDAIQGKIDSLEDLRIAANVQIQEYGEALRENQKSEEKATKATVSRASSTHEASAAVTDHAGILRVLESSLGAASSAYEALSREEQSSIAQLTELGATEEEIALARERYASRKAALDQEAKDAAEDASASLLAQSAAFAAVAPSAIQKVRSEYQALDRELLQQIETNAALGLSTEALESERVALAQRTKNEIASLEQVARDEKLSADQATAEQAAEIQRAQQEAVLSGINSTIGSMASALSAYSGMVNDSYQGTLDEISTLNEAALDAENKRREEMGQAAIEMDQLAASAQVEALEEKAAKQKKILMGLFLAEQGAALAQVAVDTALAISAVQAAWAAVPPVSIALTALAVGTGIAQAAAISAARPAFHVGGIVPGYGASQGTGEVPARLLPGEVVLNRQAVQGMGGPQAANSLNHGGGMGGSITLNQVWRGSTLDRVVYDVSRLPGSKTRQLTQGGRVGKRTR